MIPKAKPLIKAPESWERRLPCWDVIMLPNCMIFGEDKDFCSTVISAWQLVIFGGGCGHFHIWPPLLTRKKVAPCAAVARRCLFASWLTTFSVVGTWLNLQEACCFVVTMFFRPRNLGTSISIKPCFAACAVSTSAIKIRFCSFRTKLIRFSGSRHATKLQQRKSGSQRPKPWDKIGRKEQWNGIS